MKDLNREVPGSTGRVRLGFVLVAGGIIILLFTMFGLRSKKNKAGDDSGNARSENSGVSITFAPRDHGPSSSRHWRAEPQISAEEIVTNKVLQFAHNRHEVLRKWAEQLKVKVPAEFEHFFDVAETGNWDELHAAFEALNARRTQGGEWTDEMSRLWPVVLETLGVAQNAHEWPAQRLLDYGRSILDSLRPDMVYVGGTDPGRFIPTLLNETSDGERHVVLTQNALADSSYLDYLRFLYADRLSTPTSEDSQRTFSDYIADATRRLAHDQNFPNEPRQLRPGENVSNTDGRVQIGGQIAVMAINEGLIQSLMRKNPDLSFAIEQSFPFKSLYGSTTLLGPIMELRNDGQNAISAESAAQAVDYWSTTTRQLMSDLASNDSLPVRNAYGKMAAEQAALLFDRNLPAQAEETYRLASEICPSMPEVVFNYVSLLSSQGRTADAIAVVENAVKAAPDNGGFNALLQQLRQAK